MTPEQMASDQQAIADSRKLSDQDFLHSMSTSDSLVDHEDNCGMCEHQRIMAQVARDMLAAGEKGDKSDVIAKWSNETHKRWNDTKYVKLWQEAVAAGQDPHKVFEERGWEP